jgi:FSR family fosmidomycin resistance protein-like MFS transporter
MSWFSLGGNAGFVLAPLVAGPVLSRLGLQATGWLAVPALVGVAVTVPVVSKYTPTATIRSAAKGSDDWTAFGRLTVIVVLRSIVYLGLAGFVGLYAVQRVGGGGSTATAAVFALYAGAAVGTVLGGRFAERWGRLAVVRAGYLATTLLLPVLLLVPGHWLYVAIALVGTALSLPFSLHITLGQDLLPSRPGTASGVTLGLAVSAGGLFAPLIGVVVDRTSLRAGLALLILFVAAAWLISLRLALRGTGFSRGG